MQIDSNTNCLATGVGFKRHTATSYLRVLRGLSPVAVVRRSGWVCIK